MKTCLCHCHCGKNPLQHGVDCFLKKEHPVICKHKTGKEIHDYYKNLYKDINL